MTGVPVEVRGQLDPSTVAAVSRLVEEVTDADGVAPLSEHVLLHLRYGGDSPARNVLAHRDGELVGYAHLDVTDVVAGAVAEVTVAPSARHEGVGRALVETLIEQSPDGRLRLWAHGQQDSAAALARGMGFQRERVLWQLRRSLYAPLPAPVLPDGVSVRTFVVGQDEQAWTDLNNRAFDGHPDQGHWDLDKIRVREREPWFDPAGFFLAERSDRLAEPVPGGAMRMVGFHWTKVHGTAGGDGHGHEPIGEVYVVGVDPGEQGNGLGRALTLVGLAHLRSRGLAQAMLYVDDTNPGAVRLYTSLGFTKWDVDVTFANT